MDHSPGFLRISEDARSRITEISATELLTWIGDRSRGRSGSGVTFHLLDVREDHEWQAGHIPGARHLARGILERDIERTLPDPQAEIILYCGGGYRSALAADSLQRMGYRRVRSLAGGFRGWQEAGHAVEIEPDHVRTLPLLPRHIVVAVDLSESGRFAVLSALDLAEAVKAKVTLVHAIEPTPTPASLEAYALEGMPTDWAERINDARLRSAHHQVQAMVSMYGRPGLSMSGQVIFGLLPETLNSLLRSMQGDLLIVGTHGRRGLAHFFLGSVAERLVRTAPCPVLVVRPPSDGSSDASSGR
ncbi:MAG: universal stress protein [Myxococcales bacterium]|nr:universal stress protein [Myxococcales bacterium]